MSLSIFDLDNTLIAGDSDYLWGQFLVDRGVVDRARYEQANQQFYEDYKNGSLDMESYLEFALRPLAENDTQALNSLRSQFMEACICPILLEAAKQLIERHRTAGDTLLVITATNRFVTEPIAELYGIENLLATTPEIVDGRYTGRLAGIPCFQEGKVKRLEQWLELTGNTLEESWFYSDSHNDLPLLQRVDHPVVVDPDNILEAFAEKAGWPVISLRNGSSPSPRHFIK
ncbi:MAG: HAD family hydrolase [Pseudomonadota bacterium]